MKVHNMYNYVRITVLASLLALQSSSMLFGEIPEKYHAKKVDPKSLDLTEPTLFIIPYTHLDDVWRWDFRQTLREFLPNTLDENFQAFKDYPNYNFNWSGASRYAMMREYYPEKYEKLKEWVASGRWFPSGSSWCENDTNVPTTESLIRQILVGHKYFKDEFGVVSNEYMLPDCFGFPYSLPSVLAHCGLKGFSTQKLTWKSANGIPFNIGRWIGPDGEWVIAALNGGNYAAPHKRVYNNDKKTLKRLRENEQRSGLPIDFFFMGGGDRNNADRGGMPHKVSLENLEKAYEEPGKIKVITGPANVIFDAITDEQAMGLPTWNSDLLLIEHSTGVLTSQAYTKRQNRDGEVLADAAERAAVTATLMDGTDYPSRELDEAWMLTLRNQFHDTLPGTSIPKVYEQAWNDGVISINQFAGVYEDSIANIAANMHTNVDGVPLLIYNQIAVEREDIVEAEIPSELKDAENITAYDAEGNALPTQLTHGWDGIRRVLFKAKLPSVGAAVYSLKEGTPPEVKNGELKVGVRTLENNHYKVTLNDDGDIAGVYDKSLKKELFEKPSQLEFVPNYPFYKPAWHVDWQDIILPPRSVAANPISMKIVESGPLRIAIEVVRENEDSKISQRICLYAGDDGSRVEVDNFTDWRSRGALLKAAFHMTASNPKATYNLGLGTIQRGNYHEVQFEVPNNKWLDLTDSSDDFGVTILSGYKYASDKPDDNTLRLTLMHSPDTDDWPEETKDRGRTKEMRWQDWGRHEFKYAIVGHKGDWRDGMAHMEAQRFEQRPGVFVVPQYKGNNGSSFSLLEGNNPQISIQAVKKAEYSDQIVVRFQEWTGKSCDDFELSTAFKIESAEECDGVERPLGNKYKLSNGKLKLSFTPYEVKSVLLKLKGKSGKTAKTTPIELEYNRDVFSYNHESDRPYESGSMDGKGGLYPAEMIGDTVEMGNVTFNIGPRSDDKALNAVSCRGQEIDLPKGTEVVHILAAADVDTDVVFKAGSKEIPLTIGGWSGNVGMWDNREFEGFVAELSYSLRNPLKSIEPAYVKDQRLAWYASHRHLPNRDTYYEYGYMFAYRLEVPKGTKKLTLPDSMFVHIAAISVGDERDATSLRDPFQDLHRDEDFRTRFLDLASANEPGVRTIPLP